MIICEGKYGEAKIAADFVESSAMNQINELLNTPVAENAHIRIMPDVHAGAGCVIGTSMIITNKIVPNLVGVDIGCGVFSQRFDTDGCEIDFAELDNTIRNNVPHGFGIHETSAFDKCEASMFSQSSVNDCINAIKAPIDKERAFKSVGSLGGGNHFIEVNKCENGDYMLNIHSGSRHMGVEVANYYQTKAVEHCANMGYAVPKALAFLEGELFDDYMHDMALVQMYAHMNRIMISDLIYYNMLRKDSRVTLKNGFSTVHNYIDKKSCTYAKNKIDDFILRKGAVAAYEGQMLVIPINMKDGTLLCRGKGNAEWNWTAPHGAGRLYSRGAAKSELSMEDFKNDMKGIYTSCVKESTLDECPRAYKGIDSILQNIEPMAEVVEILKPVYNFKA